MRERNTPYATRHSQFPIRSGVALVATSIDTEANIIYIIIICIRISRKIYARETTRIAVVASINCFFFFSRKSCDIYVIVDIYMKFSKTVGNSWHNVLDQLQPGIPGETVQERHGGREELYTSAATGRLRYYYSRKYNINIIIRYTRLLLICNR